VLRRQLRSGVWRERLRDAGVGEGEARSVAIHAARRGKDDAAHRVIAGGQEHVERSANVDLGRADWILDRAGHPQNAGEVEDEVAPLDRLMGAFVAAYIAFDDVDVVDHVGEIIEPAGGEVVEDAHLVAAPEQGVDEV
jgi:hypothetical protein